MEAESTAEMSVNFYHKTRCNDPEDGQLHSHGFSNVAAFIALGFYTTKLKYEITNLLEYSQFGNR
jgi:hypothetical protein